MKVIPWALMGSVAFKFEVARTSCLVNTGGIVCLRAYGSAQTRSTNIIIP